MFVITRFLQIACMKWEQNYKARHWLYSLITEILWHWIHKMEQKNLHSKKQRYRSTKNQNTERRKPSFTKISRKCSRYFNTTRYCIPNKMLNKLTKFIPKKMLNTIKLFLIKYWLRIKRKLNLTAVNIRLLHYHISQQKTS